MTIIGLFSLLSVLLLLLDVQSIVSSTSDYRPTGHFHVTGNGNRRKDHGNTAVTVKLLRPRKNFFNVLFSASHLAAFLRCISTIGARSSSTIEALGVLAKTASAARLHPDRPSLDSLFPLASLPSEGSVQQFFLSFFSHFLYMYLLRVSPRLRKSISFFETDNLVKATAAFVEKDKSINKGSADRGGTMIVELDKTLVRSADELDSLLQLIPIDGNSKVNASTPASGGISTAESTVRTMQLDDLCI